MPWRTALLNALKITGRIPKPMQLPATLAGLAVLGVTVVVFVRHVWDAQVTDQVILYVSIFVLLGLALVLSARGGGNSDGD